MKNLVIEIDKNELRPIAKAHFMDICGLYRHDKIKPKQIDESLRTLDDIFNNIKIEAIISQYESSSVSSHQLVCDEVVFPCPGLSKVSVDDVLGLYVYILTLGDINIECDRVLIEVYYDAWLTAFIDAGRDFLKEFISKSQSVPSFAISDSFGPGFFGMSAMDTEKIFRILKADQIGVRVRADGLIVPLKSYAGFFLITTKEESLPSKDCENCISSRRTCNYCKTGRQQNYSAELKMVPDDLFKRRQRATPLRANL